MYWNPAKNDGIDGQVMMWGERRKKMWQRGTRASKKFQAVLRSLRNSKYNQGTMIARALPFEGVRTRIIAKISPNYSSEASFKFGPYKKKGCVFVCLCVCVFVCACVCVYPF